MRIASFAGFGFVTLVPQATEPNELPTTTTAVKRTEAKNGFIPLVTCPGTGLVPEICRGRPSYRVTAGRRRVNTAPPPSGRFATSTDPPAALAVSATMDSPKPEPETDRASSAR